LQSPYKVAAYIHNFNRRSLSFKIVPKHHNARLTVRRGNYSKVKLTRSKSVVNWTRLAPYFHHAVESIFPVSVNFLGWHLICKIYLLECTRSMVSTKPTTTMRETREEINKKLNNAPAVEQHFSGSCFIVRHVCCSVC